MLTGHIAVLVVTDRPRPSAVQLGRIAQRQRHVAQPLIGASGKESAVKPGVRSGPFLAHQRRVALAFHRRAIEGVVGGDELALPGDVSVLDGDPQDQTFERTTCRGEVFEIVERQRRDVKAVLRLGLNQTLLGQAGEALAYDAGAAVVSLGEVGEAQLRTGKQTTRQDVGAQLRVDLLGSGDRRQRRAMTAHLRRFGSFVGSAHCHTVNHFREWHAISKFS